MNLDRSFYRFVTIHACETDRQTEFSSLDRICIPCSAVKTWKHWYLAYFSHSRARIWNSTRRITAIYFWCAHSHCATCI